MKVTFENNYKNFYTVTETEQAKAVIAYERANDSFTPKDWAEYALTALCSYHNWMADSVIEAHAVTTTGSTTYEWFGVGSGFMDVRIEAIGRVFENGNTAYVEFSGRLSDIANVGDDSKFNGSMVYHRLFRQA